MLVVLIEWRLPGRLLWRGVDRDGPDELTDCFKQVASDLTDRAVRGEGHLLAPAVAVLDDGLVRVEIEGDGERTGPVGSREWEGLPAALSQAKRCMLQMRLRGCELCRKLPEDLGVCMERVTRGAPCVVGQIRPDFGHSCLLPVIAKTDRDVRTVAAWRVPRSPATTECDPIARLVNRGMGPATSPLPESKVEVPRLPAPCRS